MSFPHVLKFLTRILSLKFPVVAFTSLRLCNSTQH